MGRYDILLGGQKQTHPTHPVPAQNEQPAATVPPDEKGAPAPAKPQQTPAKPTTPTHPSELFDLTVAVGATDHKDSFFFTDAEFLAINYFKLDVRQVFPDLKIKKDDLARCAFALLINDFKEHKEQSFLARQLRRKHPKK
jgi:hypothetical protein